MLARKNKYSAMSLNKGGEYLGENYLKIGAKPVHCNGLQNRKTVERSLDGQKNNCFTNLGGAMSREEQGRILERITGGKVNGMQTMIGRTEKQIICGHSCSDFIIIPLLLRRRRRENVGDDAIAQ